MEFIAPPTMQASVLVQPGVVELREMPVPGCGRRDVLVRVEAVGVCGSDTHYYQSGRIGDFVVDRPLVLGHETAGTIVAVGADVASSRVGERVSVEPQRPCRHCPQCLEGRYNLCERIEFYGTPPVDGSFAEYVLIPDDFCHRVPDGITHAEAALIEPLSVAVYAVGRARLMPGSRLLIAGAGPIGLLIAQVAAAFGVLDVMITDPQPERRKAAEQLIPSARVADPEQITAQSAGFSAFIDASGAAAAIRGGIHRLLPRGRAVLVGMGKADVELPVATILRREISLTGTFRYAHTWPLAIELVGAGRVDLTSLVTRRYALNEVADALVAGLADPRQIKAIVEPGRRRPD